MTVLVTVAYPAAAHAQDGIPQQTRGVVNATLGGVVLATGVTALVLAAVVLGRDAPGFCAEYDNDDCVVAWAPVPEDQRVLMASAALITGAIAVTVGVLLLWTGIADATADDDPEGVSLSIRRDGLALRF
ncbi:MAG: hypothetical protein DRJ42_24690 [Deltaproteobacteria bacterium]|nr:MAG: hypothetical protein DRJ42_24690 [Deltaproteobacteria bacterium]